MGTTRDFNHDFNFLNEDEQGAPSTVHKIPGKEIDMVKNTLGGTDYLIWKAAIKDWGG